jgi:hypothetical protein
LDFADYKSSKTIPNGAVLLLQRLYSYNKKPTPPFPIPTYMLLILLSNVHLALFQYSATLLNFAALLEFIILQKFTCLLKVSHFLLQKELFPPLPPLKIFPSRLPGAGT